MALFRDYPGGPVPESKTKTNLDFTEARDNEWHAMMLSHLHCINDAAFFNAKFKPNFFHYRMTTDGQHFVRALGQFHTAVLCKVCV